MGHKTYAVQTAPQAFDIARVAFPYIESPTKPGPKLRPGLVLAVKAFSDKKSGLDYASVQMAYGTSKPQTDRPPWDSIHIHNYDALMRSGLCLDTWFRLDRIQWVLWCAEYFPIIEEIGTPILGKLPHDYILTLKKIKEMRAAIKEKLEPSAK